VGADEGGEEEAMLIPAHLQHHRRKRRAKMARSLQPEEEGVDGRGAEDPGSHGAWPQADVNLADN
jgi:hypothetical protein